MSEIARRRIAAVLLLALVVAAVLALTDAGPFDEPAETEEDRVETAVERLYDTAAQGDYRAFCDLLTERARESLRENAARLTGGDPPPCARTLELTVGEGLEGTRTQVREVSVSGPHARVTANVRGPDADPELRTIYLDEIEGEWYVSDPG